MKKTAKFISQKDVEIEKKLIGLIKLELKDKIDYIFSYSEGELRFITQNLSNVVRMALKNYKVSGGSSDPIFFQLHKK